jgi:hypothetical protein
MNNSIRLLVASIVIGISFGLGAAEVSAQGCVKCQVVNGCWQCNASTEAAAHSCPEVNCYSCKVDGVCIPGGTRLANSAPTLRFEKASLSIGKTCVATETERIGAIMFDPEMIHQIAAKHPRFASSLALENKNGGLASRISTRYWTPVELRPEDIESYLTPSKESAEFFDRLNAQARKINEQISAGSVKPIIYAVSVKDSSQSSSSVKVVRLQVIQRSNIDPPYSSLEITLGEKTSWRID